VNTHMDADKMEIITERRIKSIFRAIVCLTAIAGTSLRIIISFASGWGAEVFLYFTVQSNIMVCVYLSAVILHEKKQQLFLPFIQGAIVLYILITGIVYNTMLAPGLEADGLNLIVLTINHSLTPILFFLDWFINRMKGRLEWKHLRLWLIYPLVYLFAGSIEGSLSGEFRYPFLDFLNQSLFYYSIQLCIVIFAFIIIGAGIIIIDKKLAYKSNE